MVKETVKDEVDMVDEHRTLRSSRSKVVNYDETKDDKAIIEEAPAKPKTNRKRELQAEQGIHTPNITLYSGTTFITTIFVIGIC